MKNSSASQDTRVRNAREEQTRDYAPMPVAQIQRGYDQWGAFVEGDADENARIRHEQARTVITTTRIHVVDAGTKVLRHESGLTSRTTLEATYDPESRVVTVWRDAARSVLGHTPLPERAPLTQREVEGIANDIAADAFAMTMDTRTTAFQDGEGFRAYLDEVHAAIEHPAWCQRQDCWDRSPYSEVIHSRTVDAHQWDYDGIQHTVTAELEMYSETVTPGADDSTDMQVRITSTELGEVTLLGTPEDFRKLGQYLVTAADDLGWEFDDAATETVNGVGIDWSWSITGNDKQAAGGDAR